MTWTTFAEIPYVRPDMKKLEDLLRGAAQAIPAADTGETIRLFEEADRAMQGMDTQYNIAAIRNTIDTTDAFYEKEVEFFDEAIPRLELAQKEYHEALLKSPHRIVLEAKYGSLYFRRISKQRRLVSKANEENRVAESRLVQEYSKLTATAKTEFHGETLNFYGLLKKMQDPDRAVRREALGAWSGLYESISEQLDSLYSRLVENRLRQAEVLGFESYEDMVFLAMGRFDYTREDIARFRDNIVTYVVPLVQEIYEERRARLGVEKIRYYDEALTGPDGNVAPEGTTEELLAIAKQMYRELSPETGEFFDFMTEHDMFDLESKPGKQLGGYCTFLPDLQSPFIFSNFNGTTADIDVLTHEAGHAFESYTASRAGVLSDMVFATSEVAEIHSMSMELFTYPWMERFFSGSREKADRYRRDHLQNCISFLPYSACVDEFQEQVYARRLTKAEDRYALWHELEQKYLPWRDYDGNAFLEKGGFWLQKPHIFMNPFYYIDYSLAQICALEYYLRAEQDREDTWEDYLRLCRAGGSEPYFRLLHRGRLSNPFAACTLEGIVEQLREEVL